MMMCTYRIVSFYCIMTLNYNIILSNSFLERMACLCLTVMATQECTGVKRGIDDKWQSVMFPACGLLTAAARPHCNLEHAGGFN